jgi:hypothetical protein
MIHCLSRTGLFLFALVLAPITFADETVGAFTQTSGEVRILRGENYLAAEPGVEVESQDIIETDKDAGAQLDLEDGSIMKLGPETRLALSEYKLDSNKSVLSAGIDLLSGWLRFAVSKLKPSGNYAINTPLLTIGIRGTEGTIEAQDEQGGLQLHEGEVEVAGVGKEKQALSSVRVRSGEYIQRQRGQDFLRLHEPPAEFARRLPPGVQQKLARHALDPRQRGISPRVIRGVTKEDAQRMLQRHPQMNQRLQQRFNQVISPRPQIGGNVHERPVLVPPRHGGPGENNRGNATPRAGNQGPAQHAPGQRQPRQHQPQHKNKKSPNEAAASRGTEKSPAADGGAEGAGQNQPQGNMPTNRPRRTPGNPSMSR